MIKRVSIFYRNTIDYKKINGDKSRSNHAKDFFSFRTIEILNPCFLSMEAIVEILILYSLFCILDKASVTFATSDIMATS